MISVDGSQNFLCVTPFVSQPFPHIYTRLHSCVSTDAVTEFHIGYADLGSWPVYCVSLDRFFFFRGIAGLKADVAWNFLSLFCCILYIGSCLCDELVSHSESSRMCECA